MSIPSNSRLRAPPPLPPRKPQFLQYLAHDSRRAKYNCSCGNKHRASICTCSICRPLLQDENSPCSYYGRCVEPLAWNLEHEPILNQTHCPLYSVLPKELRDLIFVYALTGCKVDSLESLTHRNVLRLRIPTGNRRNDIATDLLRTCRAVYHETWMLPLSLNPYRIYNLGEFSENDPQLAKLYPWQLALIQSLDITLPQVSLEGKGFPGALHTHLHGTHGSLSWQPEARRRGVYVAPKKYHIDGQTRHLTDISSNIQPFFESFCLIRAEEGQERHFLSHALGQHVSYSYVSAVPWSVPWSSAMRVARARPINHLTLRIQHSDWWAWTDNPTSSDPLHHLGLDPAVGDGTVRGRPTSSLMRALAEDRRAGSYPSLPADAGSYHQGWAATIGSMPDIRCLELVLETFTEKKAQLEQVIEAAKTWKLPISGTSSELRWDGHVDYSSWSVNSSVPTSTEGSWHRNSNAFDVRVIRFTRIRPT